MMLSFSPIKARFSVKENYISMRSKGNLLVEFIPREVSPYDPSKRTLLLQDKKYFSLTAESMHELIGMKESATFKRQTEEESKVLSLNKQDGQWTCQLEILDQRGATKFTNKLELKEFEMFYIKKFCEVISI